jgi:hypothetical protein
MTLSRMSLLAALLVASTTFAQDESAKRSTLWQVPLKLEGTTDGKANFTFGAGFLRPVGKNGSRDLGVTLQYQVRTTNGIANLVGLTDGGRALDTRPWTLGVMGSLIQYPELSQPSRTGSGSAMEQVLQEAVQACSRRCSPAPLTPDDQTFCGEYQKALKPLEEAWIKDWNRDEATLPVVKMCQAQQKNVEKHDADKEAGTLDATGWRKKRSEALIACLRECTTTSEDPFCKLPDLPADQVYASIGSTKLCTPGKALYQEKERDGKAGRVFPPLVVHAGARLGRTEFQYRTGSQDDPSVLVEGKTSAWGWSSGVYAAAVLSGEDPALSLEGRMSLGSDWTASTKTIRWCSPAGQVPRGDNASDPAESCQEATFGVPTRSRVFRVAGLLGLVDNYASQWRAAVGGEIGLPLHTDTNEQFSLALQGRIYWSLASNPNALKYKGLIRVAPSLQVVRKRDGSSENRLVVSLALLGDRLLFADSFDEL